MMMAAKSVRRMGPKAEERPDGSLASSPKKPLRASFPSIALASSKITIGQRQPSPRNSNKSSGPVRLPGIKKQQNRTMRYKIFPGNNCRVVMQSMKRRPWWHAILSGDDDEAIASQQPTFLWEMYRNSARYKGEFKATLLNHIQRNALLTTKKGLYLSIKAHCQHTGTDMLSLIPRTFYLAPGASSKSAKDDDIEAFDQFNAQLSSAGSSPEEAIWILKPASKTNRGFGIKVVKGHSAVMKTVQRVSSAQSTTSEGGGPSEEEEPELSALDKDNPLFKMARKIARQDGYIVQQYMERPLLVDGRKFDIRCFVLVTVFDKKAAAGATDGGKELRAFFFSDAYVRTSSKKYSLDKLSDRATHLTNDAVQKNAQNYGQFEQGNKLSLQEWQMLINSEYPHADTDVVAAKIFPEIRRMCRFSVEACAEQFRNTDIGRSFELFGYDFMVTQDFQPVLIEVNTNPCLEFVCPLLTDIISRVVEDTFKLAVDVACPPPPKVARTKACEEAVQAIQSERNSFEPLFP